MVVLCHWQHLRELSPGTKPRTGTFTFRAYALKSSRLTTETEVIPIST